MGSTGHISLRRPPLGLALVVALHVGFIYVLNHALGLKIFEPEPPPVVGAVIDERPPPQPTPELPPVGPVDFTVSPEIPPPPPVVVDEPIVLEPAPDDAPTVQPPKSGGTAVVEPRIVPVRADPAHPLTQADYPAASIRAEEEGVVELAILVRSDGRIAEVRVAHSSGYPRLDRAAVEEARRNWRLKPAMRGNVPIEGWGNFRVVFRIDRR